MTVKLKDYLNREDIAILCGEIAMPEPATEGILRRIETTDFAPVNGRFNGLFSRETGDAATQAIHDWGRTSDPTGLAALTVYLAAALHTEELYRERGIAREIFVDTVKAFSRFTGEHKVSYGDYGFDRDFWIWRQLSLTLFRLGLLEFEEYTLSGRREEELRGLAASGAKALSVHIPSDAAISREALAASYGQAKAFFTDYPYELAFCSTWLLAPALKELLPPSSRILAFQADYDIVSVYEDDNGFMKWVYKRDYDDYADLPEDTSLMRGIKARLLAGGTVGAALGTVRNC